MTTAAPAPPGLGGDSEAEDYISSLPVSSDEHSDTSHSDRSNGSASVPGAALGRPWSLPYVDGRVAARRRVMPPSPPPRVVVHQPFSQPFPPEESSDVWNIRPRAGSGRTSLGRRRRYDSYVSMLNLDELRELDDELLRRAIGGDEMYIEEEEEREGRRGNDVEVEEDSVMTSPGRQHRRRGQEEEDARGRPSSKRGVSTGSSRRQEQPCDESEPREQQRQQQQQRLQHHDHSHRGRQEDEAEDRREEVLNPGELQRVQQQQQQLQQQYQQQSRNPHRLSVIQQQQCSPLRTHRESISRGAPPPNPIFHDPKMGPLSVPASAPCDSEDSSGQGPPLRLPSRYSARRGLEGGIPQLPCVRDSNSSSSKFRRQSHRSEPHDEGGGDVDEDQCIRSSSRRNSLWSFGSVWLHGNGGGGGGGGGGGRRGGGMGEGVNGEESVPPTFNSSSGPGKRTLLYWLDQRLPRMSDEERIARASLYVSDAIDTRPVRMRGGGKGNLFAYRLLKRRGWLWMMQALAIFHLLLALWEPPRALPDSAEYHDSISRHVLTGAASTAQHLLGLELFLVLLFMLDIFLEVYALGFNAFFGTNAPPRVLENKGRGNAVQAKLWGQARLILVIVFFADICAALDKPNDSPRFSRPLRPLYFICLSETLKRWSILLVRLLGQLRDVALGTGIFLGLFSLLGLILFSETEYYSSSIPYLNFNNFLNSFLALYVLTTTQNFGALLNPAYSANPQGSSPLYFFFFMAFVLIVVLFLAHLALPRVFWVYQKFQRQQAYDSRLLERLALVMTFRCLDPDKRGWVDLSSFRSMLRYARPDFFDLHTGYEKDSYCGATEHMFGELAHTHPGRVYPHEFLSVCEVILTDYYPCLPPLDQPGMAASEWHQRERARFRAILSSRWAEVGSMTLLLLTCFFLTFYGSPAVSKTSLRGFSHSVVVFFAVEMALRLWAFGPKLFLSSPSNVVDLLIISASFISLLVYAFAPPHSPLHESEQMANLCLLFLTLRVVRLFPKCAIFRKFSSAFRVLPFFLSSFFLCVLISYSWAVFGMALFARYGEQIQATTATTHQDLAGWASIDNFNSFWSASVTLFQVATTYDWYRIMYLWMDLAESPWVSMYFLAFHLVANVVVYQLTAALFIDAFLSFSDKRWVEQEDGEGWDRGRRTSGRGVGLEGLDEEDVDESEDGKDRVAQTRCNADASIIQRWSQKSGTASSVASKSGLAGTNSSSTPSDDLENQPHRRSEGGGMESGGRRSPSYQASVI